MKTYRNYMDHISVSATQHQSLVSKLSQAKEVGRPIRMKRFVASFACLALVILGSTTLPQWLAPEKTTDNALVFHQIDQRQAQRINIPGHFWKELEATELQSVFPALTEYTLTATAHYRGDGSLFNLATSITSESGMSSFLQIAPNQVALDYVLDADADVTLIEGIPVTAGYVETYADDSSEQYLIYFVSFKRSGLHYYIELSGLETEKLQLENELSTLVAQLITDSETSLAILDNPTIPQ